MKIRYHLEDAVPDKLKFIDYFNAVTLGITAGYGYISLFELAHRMVEGTISLWYFLPLGLFLGGWLTWYHLRMTMISGMLSNWQKDHKTDLMLEQLSRGE